MPTPVDDANQPDLRMLTSAARTVGENMKRGAIVVFESTVYPGATEEVCVPAIEKASGMVWKQDFNVGYSPERINPGDRERTLTKIVKLVSGDTPETLETIGGGLWLDRHRRRLSRRPASRSPKRPRSSRTPSATSTSR